MQYGAIRGYEGGLEEKVTVGGQIVMERQEVRPTIAMEMVAFDRAELDRHALALRQFHREVLIAIDATEAAYLQQRLYYGVLQGRGLSDEAFPALASPNRGVRVAATMTNGVRRAQ